MTYTKTTDPILLLKEQIENPNSQISKILGESLKNVESGEDIIKIFDKIKGNGNDESLIKLADKFRSKIQILSQKKDPLSWLLGIKDIKDDLVDFIESVSDNINTQFSNFDNSTKFGILYDCGYKGNGSDFKELISTKHTEYIWLINRLNYRIKLKNDNDKLKSFQLLESYSQFRKIILSIQDSFFSDITKFFIYNTLLEKLNLSIDVYQNLKFIFFFVLPKNYAEYCKIYNFLYELDKFKGNGEKSIENILVKLKISFFVLILTITIIAIISYSLSIFLGIGITLFIIGRYRKNINFFDISGKIRWHLGIQAVGIIIILLCIGIFLAQSGIIEFNLGNFSSKNIGKKYDNIVYYGVDDAVNDKYIDVQGVMASITEFWKK